MFPTIPDKIKISNHALFYKELLNLQEQAELSDHHENVPYLYHSVIQVLFLWSGPY
jgi:hypothetical protein